MSSNRDDPDFEWYGADPRGIIPIEAFKVSKNVRKLIRKKQYRVKINSCFHEVITRCADRDETWISNLIIDSYTHLNRLGFAHSVEVFDKTGKRLLGGLYGVTLGAAFFGESMFKEEAEMDKIALFYCHKRLKENGFLLWDAQFYTEHLSQFGCINISAEDYYKKLKKALEIEVLFD